MKKILLIITMLVLGIGSTWADIITVQASDRVKNLGGKYYTIHYKFGNGSLYPVIYNGTTLICSENQNATPETFYFSFADENGFYKIRLCSVQKYWRFDRNPLIGEEANAAQIQIFANQNSGTYRICGLNTSASTGNSRCYMAQGNGGEMNYNSKDWAQNSSSGNIDVYYPQTAGNWCSEVILTEVSNPNFTETTSLTSGWYQVRIADDNRNLTDKFITTMDNEISNHPAHSAALGENKGATMFYINVKNNHDTGKWISVRDSRGRYMTRTAESSISEPNDNICAVYFTSSAKTQLVFTSALTGTNRVSWKALENYIGVGVANEFPVFYAGKAGEAYSNNAWTVNIEGANGSEKVTYKGTETHYGFSTVYNNGTFFFAQGVTPNASDFTIYRGSESDKYDIDIDTENKIIKILPYNIYTGSTKTITSTEWNNQENWISQVWGANGPGTTGSNMWNPIYLKEVKAEGISFNGWKLRIKLENSTLKANTSKFQSDGSDIVTIDVDENSSLTLKMSDDNVDPGKHVFNIDGTLTIDINSGHFTENSNDNIINLGTTGKFIFNSNSSYTYSTKFTINATLNDPANYNTVYSRELATFTNVTLNNLTVSIDGTDDWRQVDSKAALETQTNPGKFYYIEKITNTGVTLHTYMQRAYTVEDNTKFSDIYYDGFFNDYMYIYIPSGKKLTIDTNIDNLASSPIIKAESSTSVIQIDKGYTLYTSNIISGQNPEIIGAGTFKTTTYTTSVPLNVTLGSDWTGTVARANATVVGGPFNFDNLVNGISSKVQVTNVAGWIAGNSTTNANIILINGANNYGFCVNGTNDNNSYRFTGKIQGTGNFTYDQSNQEGYNRSPIYYFSGDLSDWTGKFILKENGTGTTTVNVTSTGNINAGFQNSSTKSNTLKLTFESSSQQNINGNITNSGSGTLNMILSGTGSKTIGANVTANNLTIINSNGAEITISGNRTINVVNLYAYSDNNNTRSSLNINMSTDDLADKLGENESCVLISVTGSFNASSLTINGHENVTVGDYDYYISYNDNAIILSRRYYSRNVTSGNFGSICLPNGAKVSQMTGVAKVLEVTEITTDRVNMIEVEEMTPGVPYIFKSNASAINLTLKGETAPEPNNSTQNYLVGNFETPVFVPISDNSNTYYILQSNQFRKVTEASTIKSGSNRCYLKVPVTPSSSRQAILGIDIDEDSATGIDAINSLINNDAEIYDLNGRRLNDLRKGINIVNGVKVIVK